MDSKFFEPPNPFIWTVDRVAEITSTWRAAPPVHVVPTPADLPAAAPVDARGMFLGGQVHICADQAPWMVGRTIVHETIAHHGLRALLGPSWRSFMGAVHDGARAGDARLAGLRTAVRETYVDASGRQYLPSVLEADEVAAALAEECFDPRARRVVSAKPIRKQAQALVGHVAREGLYLDRPACCAQLEGMLLAAQHRLRHGGLCWGIAARARAWYRARMASPTTFDVNKPPMSLSESERLLDAEKHRLQGREDWKAMGVIAMIILGALMVLGSVGYWIFLLFGGAASLIR